ncbi:MAG: hypothetical protein JO025_18695 [Verrucomicrobia bacterium]|nr:hypothetical protein [Verrucomicrobiota bacterium]
MLIKHPFVSFILNAFSVLLAVILPASSITTVRAQAPTPSPTPITTTTVLPNNQVTFAISAPQASPCHSYSEPFNYQL